MGLTSTNSFRAKMLQLQLGGRSIGRTSDSGSDYPGSSPGLPANLFLLRFLPNAIGAELVCWPYRPPDSPRAHDGKLATGGRGQRCAAAGAAATLGFVDRWISPESTVAPVRESVWKYMSAPVISINMNVRSASNPLLVMLVFARSPLRNWPEEPSVK